MESTQMHDHIHGVDLNNVSAKFYFNQLISSFFMPLNKAIHIRTFSNLNYNIFLNDFS